MPSYSKQDQIKDFTPRQEGEPVSSWLTQTSRRLSILGEALKTASGKRKKLERENFGRIEETLFSLTTRTAQLTDFPEVGRRKTRPKAEPTFKGKEPDQELRVERRRVVVIFHDDGDPEAGAIQVSPELADWLGTPKVAHSVLKKILPASLTRNVENARRSNKRIK